MLNVAVIDIEKERREAMANAFVKCSVSQYWIDYDLSTPTSADVVLIHYGDIGWGGAESLSSSAKLVVFYGGNGERDSRWDVQERPKNQNDQRIWRAIFQDGSNALTSEEANLLVEYAGALGGKTKPQLPGFLQPPPDYSTLIALSILCQGYLAAYAPEELGLDETLKKQIEEAGAKENVTEAGAKWWLTVFGVIPETGSAADKIKAAVKRLGEFVKKEWTWSEKKRKPLDELLSSITSHSSPDVKVVKNAMDAIADFLRSR